MVFGNIITPDNSIFHKMMQVGIVVPNIEESTELMKKMFGWELFSTGEMPAGEHYYKGQREDIGVKMAFFRLTNGVEVELLEPTHGRHVLKDFLNERGPGIHHIAFDVTDFAKAKEMLLDCGFDLGQNGTSSRFAGCEWAHFDAMKQLGYYIEILNPSEHGFDMFA